MIVETKEQHSPMKKILYCGALLCLMTACQTGNGVKEPKHLYLSPQEKQMVNHCNDFSFNLLTQVAANEQSENVILSPLSASMLIGMLMNGADGETLEQMQQVTGFAGAQQDEINDYYHKLIDVLPALDTETKVKLANGIWMVESYPFKPEFAEVCKQWFEAEVKNVPTFMDDNVLKDINRFAAENTENKIKEVIKRGMVNSETIMVLANALYFKGKWKDQFKKTATRNRTFTTLQGAEIQTPMMHRTDVMTYAEGEDFQIAELLYKGSKYCADIILPAKGVDVRAFADGLTDERWQHILDSRWEPEVELALPKFTLKYSRDLTDDLKALGMPSALNVGANFSRLTDNDCHVDLIKQDCFMQLDEEGTEAAAVTIGIGKNDAGPGPSEFRQMIVDRPFILVLREKDYGTILFTAMIGHPQTN